MTSGLEYVEYRRLRTPRQSGSAVIEPPIGEVSELVADNCRLQEACDYDFQGRSGAELMRQAREELIAEARRCTSIYRNVDLPPYNPLQPIFLAGHQPHLFHPGVWFKNFVLAALARQHHGQAVNLIIDSDTIKSVAIRVPGGSVGNPQLAAIEMDRPGPSIPYEERAILDRNIFESFGRRTSRQIRPLVVDPLIEQYWPMAIARSREVGTLGACLSQSRHQLEGSWGSASLEVPQSRVCDLPAFAWFTAHLLAHLPRLRMIYNEAVAEYRRAHRIRSTAHPVPDLAMEDGWLEAPYWIWTAQEPRRRRLFARHRDDEIVLTNGHDLRFALPLSPDGDAGAAAERLLEAGNLGIKIRSRALITTLWARLVLGNLFLHGIGGAKYDQVTNAIIDQFFGIRPPHYLVVSATLHLPIPRRPVSETELRDVDRRLRELDYHPERIIEQQGGDGTCPGGPWRWIEAKRRWIRTPQTAENAATRFHEFHWINAALQPWVAAERRRLLDRREQLERSLRSESILASREYSFCLFPEPTLRECFHKLLDSGTIEVGTGD